MVVSQSTQRVKEGGGSERLVTNNQMELMAAVRALEYVGSQKLSGDVLVHSDSRYLINGITKWIIDWKRKGWITASKTPVENQELWQQLDTAIASLNAKGQQVLWQYVGGHIGVKGNERCDAIATAFATGGSSEPALFDGDLSKYGISDILDISHNVEKKSEKGSDRSRKRTSAYSYVSAVGGVVQVHKTWAECEGRVRGQRGARYKKALSAGEEAALISEFSS